MRAPSGLGICLLLLAPAPAAAQATNGPTPDELKAKFAQQVPPAWELAEFRVDAQANYGTPVEPLVKSRFLATVRVRGDTFAVVERAEHASFVEPVLKGGEQRLVYGIASSTFKAGAWPTTFELENNPTEGAGVLRETLPGRLILKGSEEELAFWAQRERDEAAAHARALADAAREEELKAKEREARLAAELAERQAQERLREQERQAQLAAAGQEVALAEARRQAEAKAEVERLASQARLAEERERQAEAAAAAARERLAEREEALLPEIRRRLVTELPGFVELMALEVVETSGVGTPERPVLRKRLAGEVAIKEATFRHDGEEDGRTLLLPVATAGDKRPLHGVATATLEGVSWRVELNLDNADALEGLGQPRGYFPGLTIVRGSPEEQALREEIEAERAKAHEAALVELRRQEELLAAQRQAEAAKVEHERALAEERHKAELARLERAAQIEQEKAKREVELRMAALSRRSEELANFEALLLSNDVAKRRAALEKLLQASDPTFKAIAFLEALADTKNLPIEIVRQNSNEKYVGQLSIGKFDKIGRSFTGTLQTGQYKYAVAGGISGANLSFSGGDQNSQGISGAYSLVDNNRLKGSVQWGSANYESTLSLN
jgi:hypothetical protein